MNWNEEIERQADEFVEAFGEAITSIGETMREGGRTPSMNAVLAALAAVTGDMLAHIPDARVRKAIMKEMDRVVSATIGNTVPRGAPKVVKVGRGRLH